MRARVDQALGFVKENGGEGGAARFFMDRAGVLRYHARMSPLWTVLHLDECASTFDAARHLPPWSVVSCGRQAQGRGRFNRTWFGEAGGLWASYTLPLEPAGRADWGMLPLVAGVALIGALGGYNIPGLRLRWPNDLLVGRAKLAGILVERPRAGMASVGIGLNVSNDVAALAGRTQDPPTRLADHVSPCPAQDELRGRIGDELAARFTDYCAGGLAALAGQLGRAWGGSRPVVAITDTQRLCGFFEGVEADGSPLLRHADGSVSAVPAVSVMRLKELL